MKPVPEKLATTCCIVGGGPARMMLGYLLARAGVPVTVLEKYNDFFRDFRGDTVHPSTLELMYELGLLDRFLKIPHQEITVLSAVVGDFTFTAADFRHVPTHCKFVALMPQWDFLNFLSGEARKLPGFNLLVQHEAVGLIEDGGGVQGVEAKTPGGSVEIHADLVIGCDGRHSTVRRAAGFEVREFGVPIDVLWFRLSRRNGDPEQVLGHMNYGRFLILINRGEYFQAGLIIPKGGFDHVRRAGIEALRGTLSRIAPFLGNRLEELRDWDQVKLLSVQIDRLRRWHRPGLLCIGDAAHAMSPAGGVGINLAIQDAVAAARILALPLRERRVTGEILANVQERREFPARVTQFVQLKIHQRMLKLFQLTGPVKAPWELKAVAHIPGLSRLIARMVGIGVRPEHIQA